MKSKLLSYIKEGKVIYVIYMQMRDFSLSRVIFLKALEE